MEESEIQGKISELNAYMIKLNKSKEEYIQMNEKINQAITELSSAQNNFEEACAQLQDNYSSEAATEKVNELEDECTAIEEIINELRNKILESSNSKINVINTQIKNHQYQISNLEKELNSKS